jgi:DNA modification methylase
VCARIKDSTSAFYEDATIRLLHGNCLDVLAELPDASVDAVVTDPPYGLANTDPAHVADTIVRWVNGDRDYIPAGAGFMGKAWDAFVPPVAVWDECLRVLKPGGHALVFAGSRTVDLMTLGLRLAGFEVRDSIAWLYGSGFPKSLDVSKAIDKRAEENGETKRRIALVAEVIRTHREAKGMERAAVSLAVVGTPSGACWNWEHQQLPSVEMWPAIKATLDIPDDFDGLIEGDRAQFIAAERAVIGTRTTGIGTGKGAVAYIADSDNRDLTAPATDAARTWQGWGTAMKPAFEPIVVARKPLAGTVAANVLAHGTGALNIDACRIDHDDDLSRYDRSATSGYKRGGVYGDGEPTLTPASPAGRWPANVVLDGPMSAVLDEQSGERRTGGAIAAKAEVPRDQGDFLSRMKDAGNGNNFVGDQGGASRFFYVAKADATERVRVNGTAHPTVKPLALMRWLVRLVTPPGGTVLEPFAGSGTTVEACLLEGFNCIAIEREADYLPLITQRIHRRRDPIEAIKGTGEDGGLFDLLDGEPA